MDNAEIAASVAKALGLKEMDSYWNEVNCEAADYGDDPGAWVMEKDGSNLFHPRWQVRCRDWLSNQGIELVFGDQDGACGHTARRVTFERDEEEWEFVWWGSASEFAARAIHDLYIATLYTHPA